MGLIYADIELVNTLHVGMAKMHLMDTDDIKRMHVNILVDTGSYMLAINENIREVLQLPVIDRDFAVTASGERICCDIVGPVDIRFKTRSTTVRAMVLPGDLEPLLGAIPLEGMDVIIDPFQQKLDLHPDRYDHAVMKFPSLLPAHVKPTRVFDESRKPWVTIPEQRPGSL